jgi:hypothetical protein
MSRCQWGSDVSAGAPARESSARTEAGVREEPPSSRCSQLVRAGSASGRVTGGHVYRPLAVGVVRVPAHASRRFRDRARTEVASYVDREGFALVQLFEVDGRGSRDTAALTAAAELAERVDAAIVVSARRDLEQLAAMAASVWTIGVAKPLP